MTMTPKAKGALSDSIRALRERLLRDLREETERVYRLTLSAQTAGLREAEREGRRRLTKWVDEQLRAQEGSAARSGRKSADFLREAEKQAAYTLLNRLIILRLMEALGPNDRPMRSPAVVTGGWESRAYKDFRELAPALVHGDATEGYAFLLKLVFDDLAMDLPGIFGPAGIADLIPIPASTLRHTVEELDKPTLASCWTDDMTLGWVYQYWNDPEREALDDKINGGGKIEPHEIASKTQMFTERYMVDWLLQNSLGPMWLAMCRKHGWTPEVETDGTLDRLEQRRIEWRAKREAGTVALTELMPLHNDAERRWAYYVPQPIPDDAVTQAPETVRDLKLIDPAVGSGHFLVVALDLLVAMYREEARHRGKADAPEWSDRAVVERILTHNLHGIDLDPRAVQIAAASIWMKARQIAPDAHPERLNLVASNLKLGSLAEDDQGLAELRREVERETGIPGELTHSLIRALSGADHLGSLLKVGRAIDEALQAHEHKLSRPTAQGDFLKQAAEQRERVSAEDARATLLGRLEAFLAKHTSGDDLGLRLRGEQLAAGVRFVRMVREGSYDLVAANPPYHGTSNMTDTKYIETLYPLGKANLYAAFLLRGLELVRDGGVSAMLTMRNWMFIKQYADLRKHLIGIFDLRALGDFDRGAFEDVPDEVVSVAVSVVRKGSHGANSVAICPTPRDDRSRDGERTPRKRAATICQVGHYRFDPLALRVVPMWPCIYWWPNSFIDFYHKVEKLGDRSPVRIGMKTTNNKRYVRLFFEVASKDLNYFFFDQPLRGNLGWVPYVQGAMGRAWVDPARELVQWKYNGLQVKLSLQKAYGMMPQSEARYFQPGVACSTIGNEFRARLHRHRAIFSTGGTSAFPANRNSVVCLLNSARARSVVQDLNPGVNFEVGDISRVPLWEIRSHNEIMASVQAAFSRHEAAAETSVEFRRPGPSPWRHAQDWAQEAVDRPEGATLPAYIEELDREQITDHLSFALGAALGRFDPNGEGILDPTKQDLSHALPAGILFLNTFLEEQDRCDSLGHPGAAHLLAAWQMHGPALSTNRHSLREWLALDFFREVHKGMYEGRPIHWPLSSASRTFVAFVNVHRFDQRTLQLLLADHLNPALAGLEGELTDLRAARDGADRSAARAADKRFDSVRKVRDELQMFIASVEQCADRGAPPSDPSCPPREQDAPYAPDLDDGVMINSAALWPLLDPQWKEPKKWWKELSQAKGKKDYDWSHLAMRYWPSRVDAKCKADPSLGVAHGCFWRYHPARAWSWELRLQDEIGQEFRIVEAPYYPGGRDVGDAGSGEHRAAYLHGRPEEAIDTIEKEAVRRMGRGKRKQVVAEMHILEEGLWSDCPHLIWEMERRLAERQGAEFRLISPDEPAARADFEQAEPDRVKERAALLARLVPIIDLFEPNDEEADSSDDAPLDEADMDAAADPEEVA